MARLVLIDDDDLFRGTMDRILRQAGHEVVLARDGLEGLERLRAGHVDVLLIDIVMPYGGIETLEALHAEFPKLPIIAISGHVDKLAPAVGRGASRILVKPFFFGDLIEAIADVVTRSEEK